LLTTGCGRLASEQDMLAPRVMTDQGPVLITAPADAPAASPTAAQASPVEPPAAATAALEPSATAASRPAASAEPSVSASARPTTTVRPPAAASPTAPAVTVAPTTARALLQPMQHEYETWNNCAPVTAEMVLSYYGISKWQTDIAPVLRPHPKNYSVRMDQIE